MELLYEIIDVLAILLSVSVCVIGCIWVFAFIRSNERRVLRGSTFPNFTVYFVICAALTTAFLYPLVLLPHFGEQEWQSLPLRILGIVTRPLGAFLLLYVFVYMEIKSRRNAMAAPSDRNTEQKESVGHDHDTNDRGTPRWLLD